MRIAHSVSNEPLGMFFLSQGTKGMDPADLRRRAAMDFVREGGSEGGAPLSMLESVFSHPSSWILCGLVLGMTLFGGAPRKQGARTSPAHIYPNKGEGAT